MAFAVSELLNPDAHGERAREEDGDEGIRESEGEERANGTETEEASAHTHIKTEVIDRPSQDLLASELPANSPRPSQQFHDREDTLDPTGEGEGKIIPDNMDGQDDESKNGSTESIEGKTGYGSAAAKARLQKSSTKNEGQHTDRRYLCYVCNKLFTRRRSVRDHISKIHGSKTWEPSRSLEVIVDPATGEPVEQVEKQLYKAAARPSQSEEREDGEEADPPEPPSPPARPSAAVVNLKTESSVAGSRASSVDTFATPAPIIGKKRPAPSSAKATAGANKKGMAKVKHATPNKRPKISDPDSLTNTPVFRSPSATPASAHKAPSSKLKVQSSASAMNSPSPAPESRRTSVDIPDEEDDEENENDNSYSAADTPGTNDDGDIFCICRKGDNHTWMIACDGGCEEWFHGNCVNIRERDGDLIDKYVCPNCEREGYVTTWKRRCRRKSCRKPARVRDVPPSKYCSPDCGRKFFVELVLKGDEGVGMSKNGQYILEPVREKKMRKRRRRVGIDVFGREKVAPHLRGLHQTNGNALPNSRQHSQPVSDDEDARSEYETDTSDDDDVLPNRGGALRAGEVKAIIDKCKTIDAWRELGKKPSAPPPASTPLEPVISDTATHEEIATTIKGGVIQFDAFETTKLASLAAELARCQAQIELLDAREKMLGLIKDRSTKITDEVRKGNPKMKDLCGFDPRVSWTEAEFLAWWKDTTTDAEQALAEGKIGPPPETPTGMVNGRAINGVNGGGDEDEDMADGDGAEVMPTKGGVCIKNRCARHGKWAKMQLAELRFEQDVVGRRRERLRREEERVTGAAVVRMWEMRV